MSYCFIACAITSVMNFGCYGIVTCCECVLVVRFCALPISPSVMFYITAIFALSAASPSASRTNCICYAVSMRGVWRLLGASHSSLGRGGVFTSLWCSFHVGGLPYGSCFYFLMGLISMKYVSPFSDAHRLIYARGGGDVGPCHFVVCHGVAVSGEKCGDRHRRHPS